MVIVKILVYVCLIVCLAIYIHFEKLKSYREGFLDGMKHHSDLVEKVLHQTNQYNKETGMGLKAYVESIKQLNKPESEE